MNILIPHEWLKTHLDTRATPEELKDALSLCGLSVEKTIPAGKDVVFDIEVTTNRVDCMSVRGIAREAAAILPEFGSSARLNPMALTPVASRKPLDIKIVNDQKLCHRILAIKLTCVRITKSPAWLADRLTKVGQRPLNNIIDITNYVMWELGHPIHVFDYDRLAAKTILVREGRTDERLVTLDGKEHVLRGGEVAVDDGTGTIIDLPGIMGTENTVVTETTKNILLWIESIDNKKIRHASMGLAIRSQAAILNEKGVDPELGKDAILRAIELYRDHCEATIGSSLVDQYPNKPRIRTIRLPQERLTAYMGLVVEPNKVERILTSLGCTVKTEKKDKHNYAYHITPPSGRALDLTIPEDAIEEIARIYGYHNLPSVLMGGEIPVATRPFDTFRLERLVKQSCADWGLIEVYTHSLVSETLAILSSEPLEKHLKVSNPLSEDQVYLRRSLIPSHLEVIKSNPTFEQMNIFECANVYRKTEGTKLPKEKTQLLFTIVGSYPEAKAILEPLLERLHVEYQILPTDGVARTLEPLRSAAIISNQEVIGEIGEVKREILGGLGLAPRVSAVIIDMDKLQKVARYYPTYQPLPKHPPVKEEMTLILPTKTYLGEVIEEIYDTSRYVEKVELGEVFGQNATFRVIYRHPDKSLSDEEVAPLRRKIKQNLEHHFNAKLVGNL